MAWPKTKLSGITLEDRLEKISQKTGGLSVHTTQGGDDTAFRLAVKEDIANIVSQLNTVHVSLARNLSSDPNLDALQFGLSGDVIFTSIESQEGAGTAYWNESQGRGCTIKETIDVLLSEITKLEDSISANIGEETSQGGGEDGGTPQPPQPSEVPKTIYNTLTPQTGGLVVLEIPAGDDSEAFTGPEDIPTHHIQWTVDKDIEILDAWLTVSWPEEGSPIYYDVIAGIYAVDLNDNVTALGFVRDDYLGTTPRLNVAFLRDARMNTGSHGRFFAAGERIVVMRGHPFFDAKLCMIVAVK